MYEPPKQAVVWPKDYSNKQEPARPEGTEQPEFKKLACPKCGEEFLFVAITLQRCCPHCKHKWNEQQNVD